MAYTNRVGRPGQPVIELAIPDKQTKITGAGLISHGGPARESLLHRGNLTNQFYLAGGPAKEPLRTTKVMTVHCVGRVIIEIERLISALFSLQRSF